MSNTKELKTVGGRTIIIKDFITYGDNQEVLNCYRDDKLSKVEAISKADKLGVEKIVVSIDGLTENLYEVFKNLPLADAMEVVNEIKNILDPKVKGETS